MELLTCAREAEDIYIYTVPVVSSTIISMFSTAPRVFFVEEVEGAPPPSTEWGGEGRYDQQAREAS